MKLPRLFRATPPQPESKASAVGHSIAMWNLGRAVWSNRDYETFAKEAYSRNAVAYRCVKMIASNAASIPLCLYSGKTEVETHPLLDLLAKPNPMVARGSFLEAFFAFLMVAGNAYIEQVGPDRKPPRELWYLRPDRMRVIPGTYGIPQGFEHSVNGRTDRWDMDPLTGLGPILHVKEFNPLDDWYGMSRVEAAAYGIDRHNAASDHNKALLDNGARPAGALVFKPINGVDGPQEAPQAVLDAAERRLKDRHAGALNAGRSLVLSGDVDWKEMGVNPRDMDFGAGKDDSAWDICLAMGVPPLLIVKGSATYNNLREAKLEFFEETVLPVFDLLVDGLNNWLCPAFGDKLSLKPDLDRVSALEPRREVRRKTALDLKAAGVISTTEAREMLDYGPMPESAVEKIDASVITALIASVQTVGMMPLVRYMKSVGLFDEAMTEAQILQAAMDLAALATAEEEAAAAQGTGTEEPPQGGEGDGIEDAQDA